MGYFANGTEGDMFEARWCNRCAHEDNEKGCPVMLAHILFSYEECNSKSNAKVMLDMLIPRDGAWNAQCAMFHERQEKRRDEVYEQMKLGIGPNGERGIQKL